VIEELQVLAERHGEREFVRWSSDGSSTSYAGLAETAGRWAAVLADAGVTAGDRVVLMMTNSPAFLGAHYGAQQLGALSVPINVELRGASLRHPLDLYAPRALVVDAALGPVAHAASDGGGPRILIAEEVEAILAQVDPAPPRIAREADPCLIMSTSGTTGPSKGSVWTHGTVAQWAEGYTRHLAYGPEDRIYSCTPLFHANTLISAVATALRCEGSAVLSRRFSVSGFWRELADGAATSTNLLGSMIDLLLRDETAERAADRERARLRTLLASSVSARSYEEVRERWGVTPITAYGLTDYGTVLCTRFGEAAPAGTVGRPVDEFEIRLVDADDHDVPEGQPGEAVLRARRPWIAPDAYFGMPEETVASRRNLWFHTGDLLRRDEDGWYFFAGRVKDSMRRRGENVSAFEVEAAALGHPAVAEAAAYPVPSAEGEDEIAIALIAREGAELDLVAFLRHIAGELPYFAVPRYVRVVDDLPRTPTQKVRKAALRDAGITPDAWDRVAAGLEVDRNGVR
jgi:carnitine-CoA ligase